MSRSFTSSGKRPWVPALIFLLGCALVSAAAWFVNSTFALTPNLLLSNTPTPTQAQFHGYVEIAKPTYTASPTAFPSPTLIPIEITTNSPEPAAHAEIIQDTPTPDNIAPWIEEPCEQSYSATSGYGGNKYILIDISEQHMYVYEGDTLAFSFVASTGMNNATRVGNFSVLNKIHNAYGATWKIWMPNWLGIYWAGSLQNGIHALPILPNGGQLWAGYLGTPISYGCVVIGTYESQLLYNWAEIGTPVEIQW